MGGRNNEIERWLDHSRLIVTGSCTYPLKIETNMSHGVVQEATQTKTFARSSDVEFSEIVRRSCCFKDFTVALSLALGSMKGAKIGRLSERNCARRTTKV